MKWIVATNLRDDSLGAFEFAAWLHGHARDPEAHTTSALAIIREAGDFLSIPSGRELMRDRVEEATRAFVSKSAASGAPLDVRVQVAPEVAASLSETAKAEGASLILGRAAPRENRRLVRLGTIARRTLRALPGPVVIVPPDWTAQVAGDGPIMVAVDATPSSLAAIAFAEALATAVGRPLLAVQAVQGLGGLGTAFMTSSEVTSHRDRDRQREVDALRTFLDDNGRASLDVRPQVGPTLHTLLDMAEDVHAAIIVSGSRRLTLAERIFSASVGSELASFAEVPVAVVPPDFVAS